MSEAPADLRQRAIRSFVVRAGRMTAAQQRALDQLWPHLGIEYSPAQLDLDALFGRKAPRVLEIGFGNGEHLAHLAAARPGQDFMGVEVHPPGVGHLLLRIEAAALTNVRVSRHDAVEVLENQIAPDSLDELLVLFPDPWHKKRHHKRRLVNPAFARLAASRLKPGGVLHLATDWEPYAEWMLEVLGAEPLLENLAADGRWALRDPQRTPTRFERRGERLGHAVHDLRYQRRLPPADNPAFSSS
ncbi:MAG: tRNA (guanosine(46)-N7)-methyltransferase TrmB [Steroidobacteraceae bacterium]